jgi:type IV pilus biogenesis protein CpaD/CtpE
MRNAVLIIALAAGLSACAMNDKPLDRDYGRALKQNLNAQIADPDARYARVTPPAADGIRTQGAQTRYQMGEVTEPTNTSTTTIRSGGNSGGGSGGGGGGSK